MRIVNFIKNWSLPISMLSGVAAYFIYVNIHALDWTHTFMNRIVSGYIQPTLIFCMLFVSFCKVSPKQLKPRKWMLWSLLIQIGSFTALGMIIAVNPSTQYKAVIESAMLCLICPTACAASVVTSARKQQRRGELHLSHQPCSLTRSACHCAPPSRHAQ